MSKEPVLLSYPDKATLQSQIHKFVLQHQDCALARHHVFRVAISGGSLPATLASEELINDPRIYWDKWEIFFADERAVPLNHPDSNYSLLRSELLDKIPESKGQPTVITIDDSLLNDTQELADNYEQKLVKFFASKDSVKTPIFDLILLGCGPDGHTCSLFPGHELLRNDEAWVAPIEDSPKPPSRRITLTLPVVHASMATAFVATGEGKKEIMQQIFDRENGDGLPCALVNIGSRERVHWFCDNAATQGVVHQKKSSL